MSESFIYKRFSVLVLIALVLGVLVAQSQQATPDPARQAGKSQPRTFEIPCQELELCHKNNLIFFSNRA